MAAVPLVVTLSSRGLPEAVELALDEYRRKTSRCIGRVT
jgi:hypothetical protein